MFSYKAYGLCIHSEISFSSLPAGGDTPDLTIRRRRMEAGKAPYPRDGREVVGARIEPDLYFWIYDGREIYLSAGTTLDEDSVRTYVLGLIISAALRQRGLLVLHAACLVKAGNAIGFVGESGYGKSTLASYFHSRGYHLYNDDVMAIQARASGRPLALPGSTHIRLRKDAGSWMHDDYECLPRVNPDSTKRIHVAEAQPSLGPAPLTHLYFLQPRAASKNAIEDVRAAEAVRTLMGNARVRNLFKKQSDVHTLFNHCTHLAKTVNIHILQRQKGLENLSEIYHIVDRHAFPDSTSDRKYVYGPTAR